MQIQPRAVSQSRAKRLDVPLTEGKRLRGDTVESSQRTRRGNMCGEEYAHDRETNRLY